MKVLIVGAGMQGHVLAWNPARDGAVSEIVLGDYDEARARLVAERVGSDKTRPVFLDASDSAAVARAAAEVVLPKAASDQA